MGARSFRFVGGGDSGSRGGSGGGDIGGTDIIVAERESALGLEDIGEWGSETTSAVLIMAVPSISRSSSSSEDSIAASNLSIS